MITKSMTGFSEQNFIYKNIKYSIQIKSENSRNLEISISDELNDYYLNDYLKKEISKFFSRGKIRIFISTDYLNNNLINFKEVDNIINQYSKILSKKDIVLNISLTEINNLFERYKAKLSKNKSFRLMMKKNVKKCCMNLAEKQIKEGNRTINLISKKLLNIKKLKNNFHTRFKKYSRSLESKYISELKKLDGLEPIIIKKEVSSYLDKIDIEEEITRLDSHIKMLDSIIKKSKKNEIGMTIDFYMQEINREANTLSSKSKDPLLSNNAISIKGLVNQIRELSANIT